MTLSRRPFVRTILAQGRAGQTNATGDAPHGRATFRPDGWQRTPGPGAAARAADFAVGLYSLHVGRSSLSQASRSGARFQLAARSLHSGDLGHLRLPARGAVVRPDRHRHVAYAD